MQRHPKTRVGRWGWGGDPQELAGRAGLGRPCSVRPSGAAEQGADSGNPHPREAVVGAQEAPGQEGGAPAAPAAPREGGGGRNWPRQEMNGGDPRPGVLGRWRFRAPRGRQSSLTSAMSCSSSGASAGRRTRCPGLRLRGAPSARLGSGRGARTAGRAQTTSPPRARPPGLGDPGHSCSRPPRARFAALRSASYFSSSSPPFCAAGAA